MFSLAFEAKPILACKNVENVTVTNRRTPLKIPKRQKLLTQKEKKSKFLRWLLLFLLRFLKKSLCGTC